MSRRLFYNFSDEQKEKLKKILPELLDKHQSEGKFRLEGYIDFNFERNLEVYQKNLGINIRNFIEKNSRHELINIADIGCGLGRSLQEIKEIYKNQVRVIGFDFNKLEDHKKLDDLIVGDFENEELPEKYKNFFDLVMSVQVFRYFNDPLGKPYQKIKDLINNDGLAYIDFAEDLNNIGYNGLDPFFEIDYEDENLTIHQGIVCIKKGSPEDPLHYLKEKGLSYL
jgi:SAM-dependent methyltransferase